MTRSAQTRISALLLLLTLALSAGAPAQVNLAPQPLDPPATGGVAVVERALAKLTTHKRLLVIAAHPDDEDTSLLTLVARDMGGESAYLSLSRGEGGQNLIGRELGVGLGLLRSRELLAARQIDGGRQYFTRAYDFGYTRSLDETLRLWPREVLLEDAVRVIRRFRPQVVVSIFRGEPHPNHGQHQAAGVTAHAAFPVAGDPAALPQLAEEGLVPWAPQVLYRSAFFDRNAPAVRLPLGAVDPLAGKSIYQLAAASRSMHRSQDMGRLQELGPQETRVSWVSGGAGTEAKELFEGVDTRLLAIAATIPDPDRRKHVGEHLDAAQAAAEKARESLQPERLADAVPGFLAVLKNLRAARFFLLDAGDRPEERPAAELIAEKIDVAEIGLAAAAGIALEAATERETLTAGETFPARTVLWNSGPLAVANAQVEIVGSASAPVKGEPKELAAGALGTWELQPAVPAGTPPTLPYFLRRPMVGGLYDWTEVPAAERGEPFEAPPLVARFSFSVDGVPVTLERELVHVHRDQALGEIRRPLRVVPRIEVAAAEELLVWPTAQRQPRRLQVTLDSRAAAPVRGRLEAKVEGDSWPEVPPLAFALEPGEEKALELEIRPPAAFAPGRYTVHLAAVLEDAVPKDGERFALAVPLVDYPHIRATPQPAPAEVAISAADVKLPKLTRVGYVRGASDRVPEFLRQIGIPLELLDARDLLEGDLRRYDAVVVGSRAYETDPALVRANQRLLEYARQGGLVIVQYQQYPFIERKLAPFPLEIARPHDRVTDETAPVTLLDPAHPVFHTPNEIRPDDWNGWIQERGLYFANTWDSAYVPLLSLADPSGPELKGGLLVAKLGRGHYVYTGLAFFRQLPAGAPGAYRLFANLLAIGK